MNLSVQVERYFASIRQRNLDGLTELVAADATLTLPDGRDLSGLAAIRDMYARLFAAVAPAPTPGEVLAGVQRAAAEIEAQLPDGTVRRTANFFYFNGEGLITRVSIYSRGG
jgi:ketosteroid isomerase-like protein